MEYLNCTHVHNASSKTEINAPEATSTHREKKLNVQTCRVAVYRRLLERLDRPSIKFNDKHRRPGAKCERLD